MPDPDRKKDPIKVTDRRSFTREGERREQESTDPGAPEQREEGPILGEGFKMDQPPRRERAAPPGTDFSSFIVSLSSTAFIQLGELEDPVTGKKEIRLDAARQMIDIIDMLHAKTMGNLEPHEEQLLTGILYELKMSYAAVAAKRSS